MSLFLTHPAWLSAEIIPGLPFRWYGLMYIFAFLAAYLLFKYQVKKRALAIDKDTIVNAFFWGIIGLLVGARLFYMFFFDTTGAVGRAPWIILVPIDETGRFTGYQGMNWYGGVVGAVIAMVIYLRKKKQDVLEWGDLLIAAVPLAHTFGRIGNFINGELYGRLTSASWGMIFPTTEAYYDDKGIKAIGVPVSDPVVREMAAAHNIPIAPGQTHLALPRHPTQIYSMIFECLLVWAIIWFIFRNRKPFKGFILGLYIAMYGFVRFIIDYFRVPLRNEFLLVLAPEYRDRPYLLGSPFNFSLDHLFSFTMFALGIFLLLFLGKRAQRGTLAPQLDSKTETKKMKKKIDKMDNE
jgi:phosphatidylglycerol---prolipoprotein diacylglyceryl transferase